MEIFLDGNMKSELFILQHNNTYNIHKIMKTTDDELHLHHMITCNKYKVKESGKDMRGRLTGGKRGTVLHTLLSLHSRSHTQLQSSSSLDVHTHSSSLPGSHAQSSTRKQGYWMVPGIYRQDSG